MSGNPVVHVISGWAWLLAAAFVDKSVETQRQSGSVRDTRNVEVKTGFIIHSGQSRTADLASILLGSGQRQCYRMAGGTGAAQEACRAQ
ncbi:hypothetical protein D3C81_1878040 [compost metagenome]